VRAVLVLLLVACGASQPPRVVERVVTIPLKERCASPLPTFKAVPEPKCSPAVNPTACTWPSAAAAADFIDGMERLMEWARIVSAQCTPLAADGGPP
jgi:hypothetical protein